MNLGTPYDLFYLSIHTNWKSHKEDGKDYSFDVFCDLLIRDQHKFLHEVNIGSKQQYHFIKEK